MKAVAYMLDTNVWSVFKGDKAEYAIGGPTIELLVKSYNQKYGTNNHQVSANNGLGYQWSVDGGTSWTNDGCIDILGGNDGLYNSISTDLADGYWIASPAGNNSNYLVWSARQVHYISYHIPCVGFRPVVCLNSNVQLEKNSDATYTIR